MSNVLEPVNKFIHIVARFQGSQSQALGTTHPGRWPFYICSVNFAPHFTFTPPPCPLQLCICVCQVFFCIYILEINDIERSILFIFFQVAELGTMYKRVMESSFHKPNAFICKKLSCDRGKLLFSSG